MEYTEEVFLENFINDYNELGEDAKYIYEEIFSSILNEKVDLSLVANPLSSPTAGYNLAKAVANPTSAAATEIVKPVFGSGLFGQGGIMAGLSGMFSKLRNKIGTLFAGLKGKSFNEILSGGLGWLKNPANMPAILGTAGGAALIIMILRALKKRKRMNEYRKIQQLALKSNALKEEFEDELTWGDKEYSLFVKSKNELIRECYNNARLERAVFKGYREKDKISYFDY